MRDGSAPPNALFSFNLFAINAADFEKIHRLRVEYYQRVRELIAASSDPDRVVLMNLQLCPLSAELAAEAADNVAK